MRPRVRQSAGAIGPQDGAQQWLLDAGEASRHLFIKAAIFALLVSRYIDSLYASTRWADPVSILFTLGVIFVPTL